MSKLSVVLFLRRLVSPGSMLRKATLVLAGVIPVSTLVFIIATSLQCDLLQPWDVVGDSCPSWFLRWEIHGIVECLFEVAIVALPILLVWKLQTGTENKAEVVAPFAFRLVYVQLHSIGRERFPLTSRAGSSSSRRSGLTASTPAASRATSLSERRLSSAGPKPN